MKEEFLHYAWQYRLFVQDDLKTIDGESVTIVDVGQKNIDSGPDFFNAKIIIGNTLWAGNVEIHLLASDWYQHSHQEDFCYDSVILHVVWRSDTIIHRHNGESIPQLVLPISDEILKRKGLLDLGGNWIRCEKFWQELNPQFFDIQLSKILYERLLRKGEEVLCLLELTKNDWEEVFYRVLLKSFGLHVNSLPFELLSKSLPLSYLRKHRDNLFQLEALLLGQASLLEAENSDEYLKLLKREYCFLSKKFNLVSIDRNLWKFSKMRPSNFPTIKIVQFASLLYQSDNFFPNLLSSVDIESIKQMFRTTPSDYWNTHYQFGKPSVYRPKQMGENAINLLIINAVIPILFAYAQQKENEELLERTFSFLETLPAEQNSIVEGWKNLGVFVENSYRSQALIELKRQYCDLRKCLRCGIGHALLSSANSNDTATY